MKRARARAARAREGLALRLSTTLACLALTGCGDAAQPPAPPPARSAAALPDPVLSARRPSRRHYLGRVAARCEVYSVDGDTVSPATPTPCPHDLLPGERIRIAGMTCAREGTDPARQLPVVCPDPLTDMEKRDRGARP